MVRNLVWIKKVNNRKHIDTMTYKLGTMTSCSDKHTHYQDILKTFPLSDDKKAIIDSDVNEIISSMSGERPLSREIAYSGIEKYSGIERFYFRLSYIKMMEDNGMSIITFEPPSADHLAKIRAKNVELYESYIAKGIDVELYQAILDALDEYDESEIRDMIEVICSPHSWKVFSEGWTDLSSYYRDTHCYYKSYQINEYCTKGNGCDDWQIRTTSSDYEVHSLIYVPNGIWSVYVCTKCSYSRPA